MAIFLGSLGKNLEFWEEIFFNTTKLPDLKKLQSELYPGIYEPINCWLLLKIRYDEVVSRYFFPNTEIFQIFYNNIQFYNSPNTIFFNSKKIFIKIILISEKLYGKHQIFFQKLQKNTTFQLLYIRILFPIRI